MKFMICELPSIYRYSSFWVLPLTCLKIGAVGSSAMLVNICEQFNPIWQYSWLICLLSHPSRASLCSTWNTINTALLVTLKHIVTFNIHVGNSCKRCSVCEITWNPLPHRKTYCLSYGLCKVQIFYSPQFSHGVIVKNINHSM
jgi:hypothetical protein